MRDGVPKSLPVPRKWQKFVECADRPADRGTQRVVDRLVDAVRDTFSKYFASEQRDVLIQLANQIQPALPGMEIPSISPEAPNTHHLADLLQQVQPSIREGQKLASALTDVLAAKMEADVAAHMRQISQDLASKCRPQELLRVRTEMNRAASRFDAKAEAQHMLSAAKTSAKDRLPPDEDIR